MSDRPGTLGALRASGWESVPVKEELRRNAIARMRRSLERFGIEGITTTRDFQHFLVGRPEFAEGRMSTRLVDRLLAERGEARRT